MKKVLLFSLIFLSVTNLFADSTIVTNLKIGKLGGAIREMKFVNASTGYCCGDDITFTSNIFIAKTTDAGATWFTVTPPGLTRGVISLEFVNANTGIAVGNAGLVLRTTNAGVNWATIDISPYTGDLSDVTFSGVDTGYACGASVTGMATNTVLKTVNGGLNWTMLNTNCTSSRSIVEVFENQTVVCSGSSGVIIRSTNGGANWDSLRFGTQAFNGMKRAGSNTLWAVGNSQVVYKSTNRGANFTLALDNGPSPLYSVDFLDSLKGLIVGSNGINYITSNGGVSWDSFSVAQLTAQVLFSACYKSATEIFASGQQGTIMRTTNSGGSWDYVESSNRFHAIDATPGGDAGVAVGWRGAIIKTLNSGNTWTFMKAAQGFELYDVKVFDASNFYICGGGGTFGITTNGGTTFTYRNTPVASATNRTMYWFNLNEGYCAGDNGELYYTTNAGTNWTSQLSWGASNNDIEDVTFIDNNTGYVCGQLGRVVKTTNRSTWDSTGISHPTTAYVYEMKWLGASTGFAGSQNGGIYRTSNGGANWTLANDTTGLSGVNVYSFDYQFGRGIAVGTKGKVFRYQDNNPNLWILSQSNVAGPNGTTIDLWGFKMRTANGGFACGYQGALFYIGINPPVKIISGSEVVTNYSLEQNYPNPFNPSTTIKFAIPKNQFVKISVFDISGREVQVLVNENLTQGVYETEFRGDNLSSGTYFYKIETPSYSNTKRMVLVK